VGTPPDAFAPVAYRIIVMLRGAVVHRLLNKKHGPLGRALLFARSACPVDS
jgi:hypothetical protein